MSSLSFLESSLTILRGVGEKIAAEFSERNLNTVRDLLFYFPLRYEDRSTLTNIEVAHRRSESNPEYIALLILQCQTESSFPFKNRTVKKFIFSDTVNQISVVAFDPKQSHFHPGEYYILTGKVKMNFKEYQISLTEFESFDEDALKSLNAGRIVPIYKLFPGFSQKRMRSLVNGALKLLSPENFGWELPQEILVKYKFPPKHEDIKNIHFPESHERRVRAREALAFEELALFHSGILRRREECRRGKERGRYDSVFKEGKSNAVIEMLRRLPFELTDSQKKAIDQILNDMSSLRVMQRLLQGDVGSGKTVVSAAAAFMSLSAGYQVAIMGATDILARQLYEVYTKIFSPYGFVPLLLTSSVTGNSRKEALSKIRSGEALLIIGTHSLFQDEVEYVRLKLAVIDEQHRFGVLQREALEKKGKAVDLLTMSATPIPRSLSLTAFGEMDITILNELPTGRLARLTKVISENERPSAYRFLISRLREKEQAYVVFPVIEESKEEELKSLKKEYRFLKEKIFSNIPTAFVHGQMGDEEIREAMEQFRRGEILVLFATTLIEVGLDNPRATVVIIESAQRFGLSTLHQIRGRVGRASKQGYCYAVLPQNAPPQSVERLEAFASTDDGFRIAELDLIARGPGEILGTKQAGIPDFNFANLVSDQKLLDRVRKEFSYEG